MELKLEETVNEISILNNPFKKECVTDILIKFSTGSFSGEKYWYGYVEFKNGGTSGRQDFKNYQSDEFKRLVLDIENFVKSLK